MKVGDAAMKSQRLSISRINMAEVATRATKKAVRMNQPQLQLMMDRNISQSLKTLIRNVFELQGSRKFEYLIPKPIASKPTISVLRNKTRGREMSCKITSDEPMSDSLNKELDVTDTSLVQISTDSVNKTSMQRLAEAVRVLTASFSSMVPLRHIQGKFLKGLNTYGNEELKSLSSNKKGYNSYLFAFKDGFGKSSNVGKMGPVRNWAANDSQCLLHCSVSGAPSTLGVLRGRTFSTSASSLKKKDGKDCKKKGGSLPCLKSSGIVKQDGKDNKQGNKICEKFCMPCCPPARDPPECVVAQKKRECKKFRAPRPAYSECKKDPMKSIKPCECLIQRLPPCGLGESKSSKAC